MPDSFLHERSDFKALVATVADSEKILDEENLSFDREGRPSVSSGWGEGSSRPQPGVSPPTASRPGGESRRRYETPQDLNGP